MSRQQQQSKNSPTLRSEDKQAGGGLLHRRSFLTAALAAGGAGAGMLRSERLRAATDAAPVWMQTPGAAFSEYGVPSRYESAVTRAILKPYGEMAPGTGVSLTPLQNLRGNITPNGLHFERSHNGTPDIDPEQHTLTIHGKVAQNLSFSMSALLRYPMVSKICFIECSGNSFFNSNLFPEAMQVPVGHLHGLVSAAEWTGVPLSALLDEAGVDADASWLLAEGADAAAMSRSIPLSKSLDDVIVALYQNGERIRPEQGYPVRLVVPGFEGNMNVKWLRRIKVTDQPAYSKDETSKYSELRPDGKADLFTYTMGVKSTLTHPATGITMQGPGLYELSGLAWSGHGAIKRVEVSADGGASWADAALDGPVLSQSLTRFKLPWAWDGSPLIVQSRAHDEHGNVQPTRKEWSAGYANGQLFHNNAIQSFKIESDGSIANVYV